MDDVLKDMPPILLADHPALNFVNSWAKPAGVEKDWISDGPALVDWLMHAGVGEPKELGALTNSASRRELDMAAAKARALRSWLRSLLDRHAGKPLPRLMPARLAPLNELLAADQAFRQVNPAPAGLSWKRLRHPLPVDNALLLPIADAIGDLLTQEDFSLIRFCEGAGCVLVFLDKTKSHARRWCSMAGCGNRAKAAAHRARAAGRS
jgi:predicted RNA-binding Zn ribbon-like protein